MTIQNIGKFTTVEGADNGIILRHRVDGGLGKEFFVGLPVEDALLEFLQARKEARILAQITALLDKGDVDGAGALVTEAGLEADEDLILKINRHALAQSLSNDLVGTSAQEFVDLAASSFVKKTDKNGNIKSLTEAAQTVEGVQAVVEANASTSWKE